MLTKGRHKRVVAVRIEGKSGAQRTKFRLLEVWRRLDVLAKVAGKNGIRIELAKCFDFVNAQDARGKQPSEGMVKNTPAPSGDWHGVYEAIALCHVRAKAMKKRWRHAPTPIRWRTTTRPGYLRPIRDVV